MTVADVGRYVKGDGIGPTQMGSLLPQIGAAFRETKVY
jgi:hypothetical protein